MIFTSPLRESAYLFSDRIGSTIKSSADRIISHFSFPMKVEATMAKEKRRKKKIDQKIGSGQTELSNEKRKTKRKRRNFRNANLEKYKYPVRYALQKPPSAKRI